ncbi:hypothetical protein [Halomonas sp. SpR1]|uniref:cache domain-containing protein n=1 Tax=Halomonas sp. SpR1 TaxID=3050462 RepID=UPI0027E4B796|nr:hypothetical protein [Halomonas sp. SpR1]
MLALASPCLLAIVTALVIYNLVATNRTAETVDQHTREQAQAAVDARLSAIAAAESERIQGELDSALMLAEQLARTNALMGATDAEGRQALYLSRRQLSNIIRQTVADNPSLLDTFIGWEPNAFGDDARYVGEERYDHDGSGRFMPWWYRTETGELEVLPLGDTMDSQTEMANGVREGEYYLCPKETLAPCVIDPAIYDYNGESLLATSFNAFAVKIHDVLVDVRASSLSQNASALASRSSKASADIRQRISASTAKVESGTQLVRDAEHAMHELSESVVRVNQMLGDISIAASDQMTQQNAALVEESTTAAEQLKEQADRLAELVGGFTLADSAAADDNRLPPPSR